MAIFNFQYKSAMVNTEMEFIAIIPQEIHKRSSESPEIKKTSLKKEYPVLYLLHSDFSSASDYVRHTNLETFAEESGIAVIIPEGFHGFYSDYTVRDIAQSDPNLPLSSVFTEMRYESYIVPELYHYVAAILPVSTKRENVFIGGVGMGGFGALKIGLKHPELFDKIFTIDGYTDLQWMMDHCPDRKEQFEAIFGGLHAEKGAENDFSDRISKLDMEETAPVIIQRWSEENQDTAEMNRLFGEALKASYHKYKIDIDQDEPGWGYIDRVLSEIMKQM